MHSVTLTVRYADKNAAVFIVPPPAATVTGDRFEQWIVTGPRPIVSFPGFHDVGDFETWKAAKEREGFTFSNRTPNDPTT